MRILLQLPYPGYLRMYGSTVRELERRGHTVLLSYDLDKNRDPSVDEVEALAGVEVVPALAWAGTGRVAGAARRRLAADYLRYLGPRFTGAPYLRKRIERFTPAGVVRAARLPGARLVGPLVARLLVLADRLVAPDEATLASLRELAPDVVLVSPLVARGPSSVRQTDTVKAARKLGIAVVAGIGSWDHLTTKGLVKALPDRILVWNEVQRREARELHRVPDRLIAVTGAQLFDTWFERHPATTREQLLAPLGLDPAHPLVLYVGSSPNITDAPAEESWVRRWLEAARARPGLAELSLLVRPHPGNVAHWREVELPPGAAIAPRERPSIPMTEADEALYFDSIHHAAAVVGINTSAIVESLIQRRPVLTVRTDGVPGDAGGDAALPLPRRGGRRLRPRRPVARSAPRPARARARRPRAPSSSRSSASLQPSSGRTGSPARRRRSSSDELEAAAAR